MKLSMFSLVLARKDVEQTVDMPLIWCAMTFIGMWGICNDEDTQHMMCDSVWVF